MLKTSTFGLLVSPSFYMRFFSELISFMFLTSIFTTEKITCWTKLDRFLEQTKSTILFDSGFQLFSCSTLEAFLFSFDLKSIVCSSHPSFRQILALLNFFYFFSRSIFYFVTSKISSALLFSCLSCFLLVVGHLICKKYPRDEQSMFRYFSMNQSNYFKVRHCFWENRFYRNSRFIPI